MRGLSDIKAANNPAKSGQIRPKAEKPVLARSKIMVLQLAERYNQEIDAAKAGCLNALAHWYFVHKDGGTNGAQREMATEGLMATFEALKKVMP